MKLQSVNFERAVKVPWETDLVRSFEAKGELRLRANEGWVFIQLGKDGPEQCFPVSMVGPYGATPVKDVAPTVAKGQVRR